MRFILSFLINKEFSFSFLLFTNLKQSCIEKFRRPKPLAVISLSLSDLLPFSISPHRASLSLLAGRESSSELPPFTAAVVHRTRAVAFTTLAVCSQVFCLYRSQPLGKAQIPLFHLYLVIRYDRSET